MKLFFTKSAARLVRFSLLTAILGLTPSGAFAYDWAVDAHVVVIEGSYVGWTTVYFTIDQTPSASCPAGNWLHWNTLGSTEAVRIANEQAVFSLIMAAKLSGKRVKVHGNNTDCGIDFIHMVD